MALTTNRFTEKAARAEQPKYRLLADHFRSQMMSHKLVPGSRLPSFAEMRSQFGVTSNTIERAYGLLEQEGLIDRRSGSGVYVAQVERVHTGNIGLLIHSTNMAPSYDSTYMQTILDGIRESSSEQGMKVVLIEDDDAVNPQQLDGILLHSDKFEINALDIPSHIPQVMLFQHVNSITAVTANDFSGSKLATSYLIKRGHRRIACLMEEFLDIPIQRRGGYYAALQDAGITVDPKWLRLTERMWPSDTMNYLEWGRHNMRAWLEEGWRDLNCTAIVVQNDHSAIGVMQTLQDAGIDVPGDVSVIGFDGTHICDLARPRLTSVEVPLRQIGYEAIKVLCEQIQNGPQEPREISLPVKLRDGDSVAKIN